MYLKRTAILCLLGVSALATSAHAGGWNRGEADTDILYEDGAYVMRGGAVYVVPHRKFDTVTVRTGPTTSATIDSGDDSFSKSYWIPSLAFKFQATENLGCALTYTQPFGADAEYGYDAQRAAASWGNVPYGEKGFITNEYAATCDVSMDVGKGRIHFLGGVFVQDFSYTAVNEADNLGSTQYGTLRLEDDSAFGYRFGVGYDIPEYALRAQLMYRSQVDHESNSGSFDVQDLGVLYYPASGYGSLPQSVKLSLQTGVAPGWMVYGSVKWTDWSVMQALNYEINGGARQDVYNWQDGWTITAGVAHAFSEKFGGTINVTWDKGVATGADIYSDTWTFGAGVSIKHGPGEWRLGGAVSYLTEGSQSLAKDATFNATADGDWAYALSANYRITF